MNREPTGRRIIAALALAPMTDAELSRVLTITERSVANARNRLCEKGVVRLHSYAPRIKKFGRTPYRYALV